MENNTKNYNNLESEYDMIYLIMKNNDIFGVYDNSDIVFVKYINLINHDLEILRKLNIDDSNLINQVKDYKIHCLIKNSDIITNIYHISLSDFCIKDNNNNLIDLNFLESKIRIYLLSKINQIRSKIINTGLSLPILNQKYQEEDDSLNLEENLEEKDKNLEQKETNLEEENLEQKDKNLEQKDSLREKIEKLENIKKLQESISQNNTDDDHQKKKEEVLNDYSKDRREIESRIRELKQKKKNLMSRKIFLKQTVRFFTTLKNNLQSDPNFIIPELFIRKFEIFKLMEDNNKIDFDEYLKYNPFKNNISVSSELNQIFSEEENVAYISEGSEYSDSSNDDDNTSDDESPVKIAEN